MVTSVLLEVHRFKKKIPNNRFLPLNYYNFVGKTVKKVNFYAYKEVLG